MIVVSGHQPSYNPYPGFFNKIGNSDVFVFTDDVQFSRKSFQHRNRILSSGVPVWLTVYIYKTSHDTLLSDVKVCYDKVFKVSYIEEGKRYTEYVDWVGKHRHIVKEAYKKSPYYSSYADVVLGIPRQFKLLVELNKWYVMTLCDIMGIRHTTFVSSSCLPGDPDPSVRIAKQVESLGGEIYLSGPSGRKYLDEGPFHQRGISVCYQKFHQTEYPQIGVREFVPYMGIVDALFNVGASRTREIIERGFSVWEKE